ncbi:hypothetical protein JL721_12629 [Aureococcus anophagefferens]|nr:hypothetical protein JL721_12629 [Aureococcus anophagefferens]
MANIHSAIEGDGPAEPPRLVCHAYRLLLPTSAATAARRQRIRRDARGVVHAIMVDHAMHGPTQDGRAVAKADDDRWGLYYGVKLLSRESDEAKLFWSLLDESHGTDFLAFYLYCVTMIRKTATEILRDQGDVLPRRPTRSSRRS